MHVVYIRSFKVENWFNFYLIDSEYYIYFIKISVCLLLCSLHVMKIKMKCSKKNDKILYEKIFISDFMYSMFDARQVFIACKEIYIDLYSIRVLLLLFCVKPIFTRDR